VGQQHASVSASETPNKLLSIITINRNNAAGLARTLASLQPLRRDPRVEFIGIDGCSSDGSAALASTFYEPACFVCEPDAGIYDAMNKGLWLATGDYCYWLNSGDTFIADCWPQLRSLLQTQHAGLLACGVIPSAPDGQDNPPHFADPALLPFSSLNHQCLFFRTSVIRTLAGYRLNLGLTADRDLVLRLLASGASVCYEPLLVARYELGGLSANKDRLRRDHLRVSYVNRLITTRQYAFQLTRYWIGKCLRWLRALIRASFA
jgi:glycosyltransferase involved in cell wall biosynthesis